MSLTRVGVEKAMVSRLKEVLTKLKRSTVTDGANPDLNDPVASALEWFGILPTDRTAVADADLANLDDTLQGRYLDLVELRALETFAANAISLSARTQQWEDYRIDRTDQMQWLLQMIEFKQKQWNDRYNTPNAPAAIEMDSGIRHKLHLHRGRRRPASGFDVSEL
jgi:hypothetical protein